MSSSDRVVAASKTAPRIRFLDLLGQPTPNRFLPMRPTEPALVILLVALVGASVWGLVATPVDSFPGAGAAEDSSEAAPGESSEDAPTVESVPLARPAGLPEPDDGVPAELEVRPGALELGVGERATLEAVVRDAEGKVLDDVSVTFYSRDRGRLDVTPSGVVQAREPGIFTVVAMVPRSDTGPGEAGRAGDEPPGAAEPASAAGPSSGGSAAPRDLRLEIEVTVRQPPVAAVDVTGLPQTLYEGTAVPLDVEVTDARGRKRPDAAVEFASSDPAVASVDPSGRLWLHMPGSAELTVGAEDVEETLELRVEINPVVELELRSDRRRARTGDVVRLQAIPRDRQGERVPHVPVQYAVQANPSDPMAPGASAQVWPDGAFVAEIPGDYTVVASSGSHTDMIGLSISPRDVDGELVPIGHGAVRDRHTSDLWVWKAADGRDYALTGTWGADGHAYVWDVTDPRKMEIVDRVQVDARTVNDVKVAEDGRLAVISREGASDRRNGIVLLDVSDPRDVEVISTFEEGLTGGVHNVFVHDGHVYAVNNGRRLDIIDVRDPVAPRRVSRFELDTPKHGLHDVWVVDGIAYTSNWTDGVVAIDVGGGDAGGSPSNPVKLGSYAYPTGWTHAAYPYRSESTGTFYVFVGDETFPEGLSSRQGGTPTIAGGWVHVVDWEEWDEPKEVARFRVPGAGSHNLWIEDDVMYAAFYNGGLRVVDVSGELRGDLYRQDREIARFVPFDPHGYIPNAPFVWGPQLHEGTIFMSDWNSGLWALELRRSGGDPAADEAGSEADGR